MNNERGSSLITVLLIVVIFMTLGLSIITVSLQGSRLTQIRVQDVGTTTKHEKIMAEIIATIHNNIKSNTFLGTGISLEDYETPIELSDKTGIIYSDALQTMLENILGDFITKYGLGPDTKPVNVTSEYIVNNYELEKGKYFTRVYEIQIDVEEINEAGLPTVSKLLTQRIIFSPTPSFFQYALGAYGKETGTDNSISEDALIINGSPDVIGDIFSPSLKLSKQAQYWIKNSSGVLINTTSSDFVGPAIFGNLFVNSINSTELIDYIKTPDQSNHDFFKGVFSESYTGVPLISPTGNNFVDMDFNKTYEKKKEQTDTNDESKLLLDCNNHSQLFILLGKVGYLGSERNNHIPPPEVDMAGNPIGDYKNYMDDISLLNGLQSKPYFECGPGRPNFYFLESDWSSDALNPPDSTLSSAADKVIYFADVITDSSGTNVFINDGTGGSDFPQLTIEKDVDVGDNGWLVVNGDLFIKASTSRPKINGNILVEGDLTIEGTEPNSSVLFNSTVYVKGKSTIYNTNVEGICPTSNCQGTNQKFLKQLILISKGDINISRVNEFKDTPKFTSLLSKIESPPNLKAYFYTDSNAVLYGVGSLFEIEGGVFARRQLIVNAIRDDTISFSEAKLKAPGGTTYKSPESEDRNSRFYVEYDPNVLYSRLNSLPRVNRLNMILDDLIIK